MPSTYSSIIRIEKMTTGEKRSTWGSITNTNWELVEDAIAGWVDVSMIDANYSLTTNNGSTDEARQLMVNLTGAHTGTHTLTIPTVDKMYIIKNSTTGGYDVTVSNGSNSVTIGNGEMNIVTTDGSAVYKSFNLLSFNGTEVVHDDDLLISDPADETKIGRFDMGSITTATTRVMTFPNYDFTPASLAGTETLTNKTLTSPTITSPTINGGTFSGTITGTYTLDGTPTIDAPTITTSIALPADAVDSITEIATALKTGLDTKLVTGTSGTSGNIVSWDGNGDAVDSGQSVTGLIQDGDSPTFDVLTTTGVPSFEATYIDVKELSASGFAVLRFKDDSSVLRGQVYWAEADDQLHLAAYDTGGTIIGSELAFNGTDAYIGTNRLGKPYPLYNQTTNGTGFITSYQNFLAITFTAIGPYCTFTSALDYNHVAAGVPIVYCYIDIWDNTAAALAAQGLTMGTVGIASIVTKINSMSNTIAYGSLTVGHSYSARLWVSASFNGYAAGNTFIMSGWNL